MHAQYRRGPLRIIRMLGKQKLRRSVSRRGVVIRIGQRILAMKIRPAIPRARLDLPEQIAGAPDGPRAAIVELILGGEKLTIGRDRESKRIPQTPRDEFDLR